MPEVLTWATILVEVLGSAAALPNGVGSTTRDDSHRGGLAFRAAGICDRSAVPCVSGRPGPGVAPECCRSSGSSSVPRVNW
jgi:hypothetical protein